MSAIQIFKPAKSLTSMEGVSVSLSAADLQDIATGYNAAVHEAPLTIGHPTHDAPAYGWVKSLSFADGALQADCEESPELGELVSKGHYKKVSASFYTPTAPGNPTPGKWSLRHVGFLGAQPPGVKGLKAVSFAEGEEGVVTFGDLSGYAGLDIARMFRRLRDWLIEKEGADVADRVLPNWDVESVQAMSQRAVDTPNTNNQFSGGTPALSFSEPGNAATPITSFPPTDQQQEQSSMKTAEQLQAELDAANTQLQSLQTAEAKRSADARHAAHVSFAEGLVTAAQWPAAAKDVLVATLDHLAQPTGIVSFGEGDAAKPLATALQEQLKAMPASVSFAEFAKDGKSQTPANNQEVAARAKAHQERLQAAGQNISISQAIDAVNAGTDKA